MADEAAGEVPVAFVVRVKGSNISELQIKKYIANQVPRLPSIQTIKRSNPVVGNIILKVYKIMNVDLFRIVR